MDAAKAVESADTNRSQLQAAKDAFSIQQQKSTREKERLSGRISELEKKLEDSKAHYRQAQDDAKELQSTTRCAQSIGKFSPKNRHWSWSVSA